MPREILTEMEGDSVYSYRGVQFGFRPGVGYHFFNPDKARVSLIDVEAAWELMTDSEKKFYGARPYSDNWIVHSKDGHLEVLHQMMVAIDIQYGVLMRAMR